MSNHHFETNAIRSRFSKTEYREHSTPLFLTSSFLFETAEQGSRIFSGDEEGNLYSRFSNPNTSEFIKKLCLLEKCENGIATASGMSAIYTCFVAFLQQGDHILASKNIFGNALYIITQILPKMGIEYTLVEVDDNAGWSKAIQDNTKIIYLESPSNPTLKIGDLGFICSLAKKHNVISIIDNCFATPFIQTPADYGADLVIHSATKYIDGQGRVLGGAVLGSEELIKRCYDFLRRTGASLSPFNAWILSKSLETLHVRMERHCFNAGEVAKYLENHPGVKKVNYPFLQSNEQYELAKKQMRYGGGLVGFELHGTLESARHFLNNLKLHSLTANLGDCRSIATHPASTTHSKLSMEEQKNAGISPAYIRLSVGLEKIDDLINDIEQAFNKI